MQNQILVALAHAGIDVSIEYLPDGRCRVATEGHSFVGASFTDALELLATILSPDEPDISQDPAAEEIAPYALEPIIVEFCQAHTIHAVG